MNSHSPLPALIKMLDDPDERVFQIISDKILDLGPDAINPLEEVLDNCFDEMVEARMRLVIKRLYREKHFSEFSSWLSGGADDLLQGYMIVTRTTFNDLDGVEVMSTIAQIRTDAWLNLHEELTAFEVVKVINHVLYQKYRFQGNTEDPAYPANFYLNTLLQSRKGNPLSLGLLYLILAHQLSFPMRGILLPHNFILAWIDQEVGEGPPKEKILFYLNPVNRGAVFTSAEIDSYLKKINVTPEPSFYRPASNAELMKRMLEILIHSLRGHDQAEKCDDLEYLLTLFE